MVTEYKLMLTKLAVKDKEKIKTIPALKRNVDNLLNILRTNPFQNPPPYENLSGSFKELYSRRINRQHRLVYKITGDTVIIVSMWTHYEF